MEQKQNSRGTHASGVQLGESLLYRRPLKHAPGVRTAIARGYNRRPGKIHSLKGIRAQEPSSSYEREPAGTLQAALDERFATSCAACW